MLISKTGKVMKAAKNEMGIPSITKNANEGLRNRVNIMNTRISP